ncbi:DUF433 domain-containing protein [Rhodocytophaga rosea]|uniref:DUF433 domain-containing protein n=1 Tax=Rhodocytophaga rosea TaxID=2704465 RepID=A0A6C0GF84_9BACT|nr:DUF433 domain-containing protein [Rhodocytophaga rosea]QHT66626.1 DUF433 domain-containing protein [Rhodocytophaga rosea]
MEDLVSRITLNPDVCKGKPTIRNMRFTVSQMLELLASGMSTQEILSDYSFIDKEDIEACLWYASKLANTKSVTPLA